MPLNIGRDNLSLFPPKPYPLCLQSTHPSLAGSDEDSEFNSVIS